MAKQLPLIDTEVSERRSIAEIMDYLSECGFEETLQHSTRDGVHTVAAKHQGVPFQWQVRPQDIADAYLKSLGEQTKRRMNRDPQFKQQVLAKAMQQAARTGWRLIALQIRALRDSILLGVVTPAEAFGGYLMIRDKGRDVSLAQMITEKVASGEIQSGHFLPAPEPDNCR